MVTWVRFKHVWNRRGSHREAWTITVTSLEDMSLQTYTVAGVCLGSGEVAGS